ncbi:MAG: GNAT family N-acetyltransferase [Anaerolineae bacterium]
MAGVVTRLFTDSDLPADLRALHAAWDRECFTTPNPYRWARPQWHIFVLADGAPVSYVGLFSRQCTLDGQPLHLGGLGSVMTPIAHRRRGYAGIGVREANHALRTVVGAPFALLVTRPSLIPFYARFGWHTIDDPVIVQRPDGTPTRYTETVMVQPLGPDPWPGGTLDLCGLPW